MIKFALKLGLVGMGVIAAAGSGLQFDESDMEPGGLKSAVSTWNAGSEWLHSYFVDHDEEIKELTASAVSNAADVAVSAASKIGEFADENKDEIKEYAEGAGRTFAEIITKDSE